MEAEDKVERQYTPSELAAMPNVGISPCASCQWKWAGSAKCDAFPEGIPGEIQRRAVSHDVPRPELGQTNKVVWSLRGSNWPVNHSQ